MKDVSLLRVRQYRIFAPDVIPFLSMARHEVAEALQAGFSFRDVRPDGGELVFALGGMTRESGRAVDIPEVRIADRKIVVVVEGDSEAADEVFEAVQQQLADHADAPRLAEAEPVVRTEDTTCVCSLDFDWKDLVSQGIARFQDELTEAASTEFAEARVATWSFRLQVGYLPREDEIRDYGVDLVNKWFVIEPRANRPLSDRIYYSESPTGSATHLRLLETLESFVATQT